jgi:hypothetical protein
MTTFEFTITPREITTQKDMAKVQADVMECLHGIDGVNWRYNDPGARAVVITIPSNQLTRVRAMLNEKYMVDPNVKLHHL